MTQAINTQAQATAGFRVIVRGAKQQGGPRVRKVTTIQAVDMAQACDLAGPVAEKMSEGLFEVYFNVYPPVGELCNGGLSKGFALVGGLVVKQAPAAAPAATTPAAA